MQSTLSGWHSAPTGHPDKCSILPQESAGCGYSWPVSRCVRDQLCPVREGSKCNPIPEWYPPQARRPNTLPQLAGKTDNRRRARRIARGGPRGPLVAGEPPPSALPTRFSFPSPTLPPLRLLHPGFGYAWLHFSASLRWGFSKLTGSAGQIAPSAPVMEDTENPRQTIIP